MNIRKKIPTLYFKATWHLTTKLFFKTHSKLLSRSNNSTLPLTALVSESGVWSKIADNETPKVLALCKETTLGEDLLVLINVNRYPGCVSTEAKYDYVNCGHYIN